MQTQKRLDRLVEAFLCVIVMLTQVFLSLLSLSSRTGSSQVLESQVFTPKRGRIQRLRMYQAAKTPTRISKDSIMSSQIAVRLIYKSIYRNLKNNATCMHG